MSSLVEADEYTANIYQLEIADAPEGGLLGVDNVQPRQLANRTLWLKTRLAEHSAAIDPHPQYMTAAESDAVIAAAVAALVASSPNTLDTLNELAAALGNDQNFATTIMNALATKLTQAQSDILYLQQSGGTLIGPLNVKIITETKTSPVIAAGALTLDLSAGSVFDVALNAAITTLMLSNPPANGKPIGFTLIITADGTARSVTWPASIKWAGGGTAPILTSTAGKKDFLSFYTHDAGATYQAFVSGQNI